MGFLIYGWRLDFAFGRALLRFFSPLNHCIVSEGGLSRS